MEVRKLKANEIEVKPCTIAKDKSWVQILLYKTSRCDMQILTELYGSHWKSDYRMVGDGLFCTISVYDQELGEWISRSDCGEKDAGISEDKSWATSAFKRAATQFGIGIELYNTPRIKIQTKDKWFWDGKLTMTFSVKSIEWDGDTLKDLAIVDRFGNVVYEYSQKAVQSAPETVQESQTASAGGFVPKALFARIQNAQTVDELLDVWNNNQTWQGNGRFKSLMSTKRAELKGTA